LGLLSRFRLLFKRNTARSHTVLHERNKPSLIVPAGAIVFDRDGLHVLVVENGVVRSRKITEVRDLGTEVEVSDGVKQGDQVVLTPPVDLEDGSKVQARATSTAKSS
jgi:hypothetical protein